jgi:hypothetical protein
VFFGVLVSGTFTPLTVFYTVRPFQQCRSSVNRSLYAKVMPPASWPIMLTTMVSEDAMSGPITHGYGASPYVISRRF